MMPDSVALFLLLLATAYAVVGTTVACLFVARGLATIDPAAREAPLSFRLIIFPGVLALWPWIVHAWITAPRRTAGSASLTHEPAEASR